MGVSQSNTRLFEVGWETGRSTLDPKTGQWTVPAYQYGAGGGTSRIFPQPAYQKGVVSAISTRARSG